MEWSFAQSHIIRFVLEYIPAAYLSKDAIDITLSFRAALHFTGD
jgi:hypothetical protein